MWPNLYSHTGLLFLVSKRAWIKRQELRIRQLLRVPDLLRRDEVLDVHHLAHHHRHHDRPAVEMVRRQQIGQVRINGIEELPVKERAYRRSALIKDCAIADRIE